MAKEKAKKQVKKKKVNKKKEVETQSLPRYVVYSLFVITIIFLVVLAQFFTTKKVNDTILASLNYYEDGSTSYRVYYKENPFYTEPYINAGKTYVSQYVDKIDTDFIYKVNYSDRLDGTYSYYVKATLVAYTPGDEGEDLWTKDYRLSEKETVDFNHYSDYRILKNIKVDYQKFVQDYTTYRNSSAISTNGKIKIEFVVENEGEYPGLEKIDFDSKLIMEIPVGDATFKIKTNDTMTTDEKNVKKVESNSSEQIYVIIIAVLCWVLVVVTAISFALVYRNDLRKESIYTRRLKKILNTYDNVLVTVEKLPTLSDLSVVNVVSFEELADAQNEVRLPINFKEDKKKRIAKFVLVRNNLAWVYTLKEGDIVEEK